MRRARAEDVERGRDSGDEGRILGPHELDEYYEDAFGWILDPCLGVCCR